jgi:hypothetical protein
MFLQYFKIIYPKDVIHFVSDPEFSDVNSSFIQMTLDFFVLSSTEVIVEKDENSTTYNIKREVADLKSYYMAYADWEPDKLTAHILDNNIVRYHKIANEADEVLMDWTLFPNLKGQAMKDWITTHTANIPNF